MTNLKELKQRFAYQFGGPDIGINVAKGWANVFAALCADIDVLLGQDKKGFHWAQVKEKFGAARFYWNLGKASGPMRVDLQSPEGLHSFQLQPKSRDRDKDPLMAEISQLVNAAEAATKSLCAVCGSAGQLHAAHGYYLTLCSHHTEQREHNENGMDSLWFADEER